LCTAVALLRRLRYRVGYILILLRGMNTYTPTIGLEIHAELSTQSKMFCGCTNNPDNTSANQLVCPVCMAHPGTLPVINREAVRHVLRVGVAVGGTLADFTEFDRKNYFYPDIPKGYQISQYKYPLVSGGTIGPVAITRIHLEEDTARSSHVGEYSRVDFNRSGVPLMELVTEPVIHDAETAVSFARDLMHCLRYLGASKANLEKGEMRIEANISISDDDAVLGTKVEVKNLNSFKAVEQAIAYEVKRQRELLERGEVVVQETRGWDENKQKTFSQRSKENAHDYRYFPEPDLPKLYVSELEGCDHASLAAQMPRLPWELRAQYTALGMPTHVVELLIGNVELHTFYTSVLEHLQTEQERSLARNYITSDLVGLLGEPGYAGKELAAMNPQQFAKLIQLVAQDLVGSRGAKNVLAVWVLEGGDPEALAERLGVIQVSNSETLEPIIDGIVSSNPEVVQEIRSGKDRALQFLVGLGMKETRGAANPAMLRELLEARINKK